MRIDNNQIIGSRITKYRKRCGYTQTRLCEIIELSTTELSNLENGKNSLSYRTMLLLCEALDVCPCQLLTGAIKDSVDKNTIDLIRELNPNEQEILYRLLLAYFDRRNI